MPHFCRSFGIENSFLSTLGPKLDFLAFESYADVLAHCGGGGGRRSHSLGDFVAAQKPFVCLKQAPKQQTLCSLLTSDMLDIASNSMLKTGWTISGTSVADTRKW